MQQQWPPPFKEVCRAWTTDHQHSLPSTNSQEDIIDAPSSKHWHLTDYVIVQRKDRQDVRVIKTMCGADCWIDHRLKVSKLNLRIQPIRRTQGKKVLKRLDVSKLTQDSKRQAFASDICSHLDALEHSSEDVDESWTVFRDTVGFPRTSILQTPRLIWWEWQRNPGTPWRETQTRGPQATTLTWVKPSLQICRWHATFFPILSNIETYDKAMA